ncbi:MAG: hypothetical protein EBZ49_00320 [Proteobacteria bacterium]|nr:hypothetical protein [Pseudomonadota bacterium]
MDWHFTPEHFSNQKTKITNPAIRDLFNMIYGLVAKIANVQIAEWTEEARSLYREGPGHPWHEKRRATDTEEAKIIQIRQLQ